MALRLIIEDDEGTTTIVPLASEAITIGRQQGNTIQLTEKNVSRRHARLYLDNDTWVIEDLGSYNGLRVNGQFIDGTYALVEGDVVQIGDYHLALTDDVGPRTLGFDSGTSAVSSGAANDNDGEGLVGSSSNLPRISQDDISAPSATAISVDDDVEFHPSTFAPEPRESSGSSLRVGVIALVVLLLGGGVAYFTLTRSQLEKDASGTAISKATIQPLESAEKAPSAPPGSVDQISRSLLADAAEEAPEAAESTNALNDAKQADGEETAADATELGVLDDEQQELATSDADLVDEGGSEAEPVADEEPTTSTSRKPNRRRTRARPKPAVAATPPTSPTTPPTTAEPSIEPDNLLEDARKMMLQSRYRDAYSLARQSYSKRRSQEAAAVMAAAACRLKDPKSAEAAIRKLYGHARSDAIKTCRNLDVELDL